jgi:hypothetical protein
MRNLKILMKSMKTLNKASFAEVECLDDEEYESLNDADAELTERTFGDEVVRVQKKHIRYLGGQCG